MNSETNDVLDKKLEIVDFHKMPELRSLLKNIIPCKYYVENEQLNKTYRILNCSVIEYDPNLILHLEMKR